MLLTLNVGQGMEQAGMKTGKQAQDKTVMIATGNAAVAGHYQRVLENIYTVTAETSLDAALENARHRSPSLLILDPALAGAELDTTIADIVNHHPGMRLIIIEQEGNGELDQYTLFKAGVHGFCQPDITVALLEKAVQLVLEGEYWIQRKLITQVISEIARDGDTVVSRPDGPDDTLISSLTPRELQVARMVHLGGNNKMIARELDISERTVKAHLSAIFRKLDIENRLHLALFFSGKM
jgi:DNA-binding NarL/FixJ family response regulator